MDFFNDHKKLFRAAFLLFLVLTIFVAILPALKNQRINHVLPGAVPLTTEQMKGKNLYVANGCVACHTQQVRNVDMDKMWGSRPSVAADYAGNKRLDTWRNTATLMGTERTGQMCIRDSYYYEKNSLARCTACIYDARLQHINQN